MAVIDYRDKFRDIIKKTISLPDLDVIDLEKGIYNWCIDYSEKNKIIKNWKNNLFSTLYVEKSRNTLANLNKDSYIKNEQLYNRMLENEFRPNELASMKPENIYPDKWSETIEKHLKKFEYAYESKNLATTDQFKCGKCKKKKCTFYELQVRSGDEGSTLFVRCINCGNQWRISG